MTSIDFSDVKLTKRCVSVTQLDSFHKCPRQWYMRHFLKLYIPIPLAPWLALGRDVHNILEVYGKTGELNTDKLDNHEADTKRKCLIAIHDYIKHWLVLPGKPDWVEYGYRYKLQHLGYNTQDEGKIDIIGTPQGLDFLVIADYKVVSSTKGYEKPGETLQLARYHHIVKEVLDLDIPWVGYVLFDWKKSRTVATYGKVTQDAIDNFYRYLDALMMGVSRMEFPKADTSSQSCVFCEFATICGRDDKVMWHLSKNNIKGRTLKLVAEQEWLGKDAILKEDVCKLL